MDWIEHEILQLWLHVDDWFLSKLTSFLINHRWTKAESEEVSLDIGHEVNFRLFELLYKLEGLQSDRGVSERFRCFGQLFQFVYM